MVSTLIGWVIGPNELEKPVGYEQNLILKRISLRPKCKKQTKVYPVRTNGVAVGVQFN